MKSTITRAKNICDGLIRAMEDAGVNGMQILCTGIPEFRPLNWYAPAIYPATDVGGQAPSVFVGFTPMTYVGAVKPQQLYWEVLYYLKYNPAQVLSFDGSWLKYAAEAFGMDDEARVIFSGPFLQNDEATSDSVFTFAAEFAAAAAQAGLGELIRLNDDFYVQGPQLLAGIQDGKLLQPEGGHWTDLDCTGRLEDYLTLPRGAGWTTETLTVLDRMQFWFETLMEIPPGLDALPETLTILKCCFTSADAIARLEARIVRMHKKQVLGKLKRAVKQVVSPSEFCYRVDTCEAALHNWAYTDQQRIMLMFEQLVPAVITEAAFSRTIFKLGSRVTTLSTKDITRITNTLQKLKLSAK